MLAFASEYADPRGLRGGGSCSEAVLANSRRFFFKHSTISSCWEFRLPFVWNCTQRAVSTTTDSSSSSGRPSSLFKTILKFFTKILRPLWLNAEIQQSHNCSGLDLLLLAAIPMHLPATPARANISSRRATGLVSFLSWSSAMTVLGGFCCGDVHWVVFLAYRSDFICDGEKSSTP